MKTKEEALDDKLVKAGDELVKARIKARLKGGIADLISQNIEQIERRPISKQRKEQLVYNYVRRLSPEFKEVYEEMQQELYESESK